MHAADTGASAGGGGGVTSPRAAPPHNHTPTPTPPLLHLRSPPLSGAHMQTHAQAVRAMLRASKQGHRVPTVLAADAATGVGVVEDLEALALAQVGSGLSMNEHLLVTVMDSAPPAP